MIRRLMTSSALAALMAAGLLGGAQAQDQPAPPAVVEEQAPAATQDAAAPATGEAEAAEDATLEPPQPTIASAFMGRAVYSSEGDDSDNIGEVNDLIISDDGTITHAVVGVGGFLGIGEKSVAVPFDELQVIETEGDIRLVYVSTREQLEAAEEFDRTAYDPAGREAEQDAAAVDTGAGGLTPAPLPAPDADIAAAPADPAQPTDMAAAPADEPADTDMAAAPAEEPAEPADMAAAPAEEPAQPADTAASDTQTAQTEPAAEQPADQQMAASGDVPEGFVAFSAEQVRASDVIGKEIYGADNESIGEVSDLILAEDGQTRSALIDVGGFLGVGEREVLIPFSDITITAAAEGEPVADGAAPADAQVAEDARLTVAMTREQLEQLSEYERTDVAVETAEPPAADVAAAPDATAPDATQDTAAAPAATEGAATFELATQDLSADQLMGTSVTGKDNETIGDVGDVIFDQQGQIEAVVLDVGGFLGIGEKPVAVKFDSLNVAKDQNGDLQLMVNATKEQLEAAPAFQEEQVAPVQ